MVRDRHRGPCAAESRRRGEPLLGTASRVRRWLIIEQPGPWGRDALVDSRLELPVAQTLRSHSRRHDVRVVLVRRPGWRADTARRVYFVRTDPDRTWIEQLDVEDPTALPRLDLAALEAAEPPGVGLPGPPALHLVCTNGRHDPCCADFGRPVVRALDAAGTPEVWESSHVGGDRFAANLVCFPAGLYFGRVEPDEAPGLVDDLADGMLHLDRYRGRCSLPPLLQAAEIFARRELDERRLDGLRLTSSTPRGPNESTVTVAHGRGTRLEVTVAREPGPLEHLSCWNRGESRPWTYRLRSLRVAS
jgi:hypothetical protein